MSEKRKIKIFQGDCLKVMKEMDDCTYTSILSDVPYGLSFMGKKWDYDVPSVEVFEEMYRITQHGGYLLCFGGSRTFHRIACNIEDAGWILKDTIMWLYGSGFPKSHNISKAIDKKYGLEREKVGEKKTSGKERNCMNTDFAGEYYETKPNHQLAKDFEGYGTALKPAYEPIIIAHKPCDGSYVENVQKHGIGGMNIQECRIHYTNEQDKKHQINIAKGQANATNGKMFGGNAKSLASSTNLQGRFPANVITDGSEEVCGTMDQQSGNLKGISSNRGIGFSESKVYGKGNINFDTIRGYNDEGGASRFFAKTPYSEKEIEPRFEPIIVAHKPCEGSYVENVEKHGIGGINIDDTRVGSENITVKRHNGYQSNSLVESTKGKYQGHKTQHIGRFPANVITDGSEEVCGTMDQQSGIMKGGGNINKRPLSVFGNTKGEIEFGGYKDSGGASRFFYCAKASQKEKNQNLERLQPQQRDSSRNEDQPSMNGGKGNPYNRGAKKVKNPHPTVKPIALMEYLAKLLKQPNDKTKILDPYCGSGTTLIACKRLDIECHGIEMNSEYVKIAKARLGEDLSEYDIKDEEKKPKNKLSQMTIWDFM